MTEPLSEGRVREITEIAALTDDKLRGWCCTGALVRDLAADWLALRAALAEAEGQGAGGPRRGRGEERPMVKVLCWCTDETLQANDECESCSGDGWHFALLAPDEKLAQAAKELAALATDWLALRAKLAEAEADTRRMDWLEADPHGNHAIAWRLWDGESPFRAALDAAMAPTPERAP